MKKLKERTREEKAYAMLGCRSFRFLQYVAFCLIPLLLPSSASMEFFRVKERVCNEFYPSTRLDTLPFKHKIAAQNWKICRKLNNRERRRKKQGSRGRTTVRPRTHNRVSLTTVRGEYHRPTVVASSCRGFVASWTLRFELLLVHGICLGSSCFGPNGLVLLLSWPSLAQLLAFLLKHGPEHSHLQSKTRQSQDQV